MERPVGFQSKKVIKKKETFNWKVSKGVWSVKQ